MKLRGVLESVLYCDDLERAEQFYSNVLGLERIASSEGRHVFFRCGDGGPWRDRLVESGVEIESDVGWPGGAGSLYFRDPAGNSTEIATPELWEPGSMGLGDRLP